MTQITTSSQSIQRATEFPKINVELPNEQGEILNIDPKRLLIYSAPKVGKTSLLAQLPRLILLDFEGGSGFVKAPRIRVIGLEPPLNESAESINYRNKKKEYYLTEVGRAIAAARKEDPNRFRYLAADTITKLEEWCVMDATLMYMKSLQGSNFNKYNAEDQNLRGKVMGQIKPKSEWAMVTSLAKGAGYEWLRRSFQKWVEKLDGTCDFLILVGHIRDKYISKKDGEEVLSTDLALTGQIKQMTTAAVDAVGYLYRDTLDDKKLMLSFQAGDATTGSRAAHLNGKPVHIADCDEKGRIIRSYWDRVYIKDEKLQ